MKSRVFEDRSFYPLCFFDLLIELESFNCVVKSRDFEDQSFTPLCFLELLIELENFNISQSLLFNITLTLTVETFSCFTPLSSTHNTVHTPSLSLVFFFQFLSLEVICYKNMSPIIFFLCLEKKQKYTC